MLEVRVKVHDRFSVEFKALFAGDDGEDCSDFALNTWIFIPHSLGINRSTYDKNMFHRDVRSNIRLRTPNYTLEGMLGKPLAALRETLRGDAEEEAEFRLKLFASIFKSAVRDEAARVQETEDMALCDQAVARCREVLAMYDALEPEAGEAHRYKYRYVREFLHHIAEVYFSRLAKWMEHSYPVTCEGLVKFLSEVRLVEAEDDAKSRLRHHGLLKKYVESALYLKTDTRKDGKAVEQFWFGMAAGIAMIVSTLVALPFQRHLGNYPSLIFIILVVAYMLKDRAKEMMRGMFSNQLKNRYFDRKTTLCIKETEVGWVKESVDFVKDEHVPGAVMRSRGRSLLEADNALLDERVLLYRKRVHLNGEVLRRQYGADFTGINDIMRMHFNHIVQQMDDPEVVYPAVGADGRLEERRVAREYAVHVVMQLERNGVQELKVFRILATRDGIAEIGC